MKEQTLEKHLEQGFMNFKQQEMLIVKMLVLLKE